jgi:hypothetical protein
VLRADLSWPIVSPEPSGLDQPDEEDCSSFSQASSSFEVMFTSSLNSLVKGKALVFRYEVNL